MKKLLMIAAIVLGAGMAMAATPQEIVTQKRVVKEVSLGADAIKAQLVAEVQKIVAAGRLAPFRTLYGEGGLRYHWREPWQMPFALSLALPYLPAELQTKVKAYLKEEIAARPPWSVQLLDASGTLRQPDDLPASVFGSFKDGEVPTAFFAYALWLYADRTGDVQTIKSNWPAIQDSYKKKVGAKPNLETVSSAVGMYRLAKLVGDDATADAMMKSATGAIAACSDFTAVQKSANKIYTGREDWHREAQAVLYAYFNLTPEAARVLSSSPPLTAAAGKYAAAGWKTWPLWWMAEAPVGDWGYYGEGSCAGPEQQGMLLQFEAWVAGTSPEKLAYYTDVPDALLGDCTWIRNAVTAIEAFGASDWK